MHNHKIYHHLRALSLLPFLLCPLFLFAQDLRVEPPNWWVGMADNSLQLLIKGEDAGAMMVKISKEGVSLDDTHEADSPNYLFVDLTITAEATPGTFTIELLDKTTGEVAHTYAYELKQREKDAREYEGFNSSDVICLITPDRFANGNPDNDIVATTKEQSIDRSVGFARHGGDLQGITQRLDYLEDMGFTAVWPSPVLENDMPNWSYHGYAITDYYAVDPRFGTLADYRQLANEARKRGIKLIMDQVVNHCGSGHWWMDDLPFTDWLNFQDDPQMTNHRRTTHQDPYASKEDTELMTSGWFVPTMPDLNQRNPFMSEYLIQNSIWWIEVLGLGGVRQDTYPYPDKDFLNSWTCRIMNEYPRFNIVGEEWSSNPNICAYWQAGKDNPDGYQSCLKSVMDFPLQIALMNALNEEESWGTGLVKLYEALANDFIYPDPQNIMVFPENHDMDRLATQLHGDKAKIKMALAYLLTVRGIPQLYYGSEVLINNDEAPGDHGVIRTDMPGGWPGDAVNAFTGEGLSADQREVQSFLKKLLNWRKATPVIATGKILHYGPGNGVYVYGRYNPSDRVVVIMNKNKEDVQVAPADYAELFGQRKSAKVITTDETIRLASGIKVPAMSALVLELE
ncbi:MAG: glycoside hydrolase family 13 protein [Bacteroidota bacterium]